VKIEIAEKRQKKAGDEIGVELGVGFGSGIGLLVSE